MKSSKLFLAAALFAGLATLSIAGPGSDYWAQQTKNAKERQAKQEQAKQEQVKTQPKAEAPAQSCSHCTGCSDMKKT